MTTEESRPRLKWARSQRFRLTAKGEEAHTSWKTALAAAQNHGKSAFDAAQGDWAKSFKISPDDATYVTELAPAPLRVEDIEKAFTDLGISRQSVKDSLLRLYEAGLVEPAPV
ncbi:MAG: TrmB family transcriptional regulator [Archangiaceae bacterium]|nr:TrmB family transcriptional regulator [Archangiaceae bacterium]